MEFGGPVPAPLLPPPPSPRQAPPLSSDRPPHPHGLGAPRAPRIRSRQCGIGRGRKREEADVAAPPQNVAAAPSLPLCTPFTTVPPCHTGTGAKTGGSPGPAAPPRRIAVANVVGKKLPNNKCLKCGRGTDSIPCVRCGNKDRNTFATIRICPSCQGYGTRERRSEGNWWANLFTAGSDGAGDGSGVQEKCPKCGGQGVQLIRNSDWS